ncbi:hypothetical protein E2562_009646 [Oryza meyeriana var. granulata]|uniref:Uncharacterized protein n=1 Tax=Oryza meyeriana var. granulata TaxID=110450 RepID=A0A6G1D1I0_9ORYZ|nr:hypothetical protein E2562_009646 [Oryza meyeriana var. granulata]
MAATTSEHGGVQGGIGASRAELSSEASYAALKPRRARWLGGGEQPNRRGAPTRGDSGRRAYTGRRRPWARERTEPRRRAAARRRDIARDTQRERQG